MKDKLRPGVILRLLKEKKMLKLVKTNDEPTISETPVPEGTIIVMNCSWAQRKICKFNGIDGSQYWLWDNQLEDLEMMDDGTTK